jgi:hypothetical protein
LNLYFWILYIIPYNLTLFFFFETLRWWFNLALLKRRKLQRRQFFKGLILIWKLASIISRCLILNNIWCNWNIWACSFIFPCKLRKALTGVNFVLIKLVNKLIYLIRKWGLLFGSWLVFWYETNLAYIVLLDYTLLFFFYLAHCYIFIF